MNNHILKWAKYSNRHFAKEGAWTAHGYVKSCSASLVARKMQIKTTMRCPYEPARIAKIFKIENTKCWQGCGETETRIHGRGNVKWNGHVGGQFGNSFKTFNINLPFYPDIPLSGIRPKKEKHVHSEAGMQISTAALLTIASNWK